MNERIRELAIEARELADIEYAKRQTGYDLESILMQKFAELIVRECIAMADEFEMDVNRSGLVDRMKEHFGVE